MSEGPEIASVALHLQELAVDYAGSRGNTLTKMEQKSPTCSKYAYNTSYITPFMIYLLLVIRERGFLKPVFRRVYGNYEGRTGVAGRDSITYTETPV